MQGNTNHDEDGLEEEPSETECPSGYEPPAVISVSPLEEVTLFSCEFDPVTGEVICR
ncbi:MAG: hypothetical protein AAF658_07435 [Myxococcota bacterium]